jgi:hypothetical protein
VRRNEFFKFRCVALGAFHRIVGRENFEHVVAFFAVEVKFGHCPPRFEGVGKSLGAHHETSLAPANPVSRFQK